MQLPRSILLAAFALILLALFTTTYVPPVHAAAIVVTTAEDNTTPNGACSLREAIENANNNNAGNADCDPGAPGLDIISFNIPFPGAGCTAANVCTITLGSQLPNIDDDVTLDGSQNSADIDISGNNAVRIVQVNSTRTLTLETLTLANGLGANLGGAIFNLGTLNINNSTFFNNRALVGSGAAAGGAIYSQGNVNVTNSTFSGNTAVGNFGATGGAIQNATGIVNVTNSTFVNNSVNPPNGVGLGGAIYNSDTLNVTNSTFFTNNANSSGGGAILNATAATLNLINSTLSNNNTSNTFPGGGVRNQGTAVIKNSIIASSQNGDCVNAGGSASGNNNLIGDAGTACGFTNGANGNIVGSNPILNAPLGNGGPTDTMALANNSVAIDAGDNAVCDAAVGTPTFGADGLDQRGEARDDLNCDIGAFEFVFSDGHTIIKKNLDFGPLYTFGPTLAGITSGSFYSPTLTINRELVPPVNSPPANALPITWDASTDGSDYSFIVTLCYDPGVLTGQDEDTLHVFHYNGATWDDLGGNLDILTYLPYHCVTATTPLTGLSPIILAPTGTTAVNVAGVTAHVNRNDNVAVKWRTTSESQIAGFEVFRKTRKQGWDKITDFLQAKHSGSDRSAEYRFVDKQVNQGQKYSYKIKVFYLDGYTEWTSIVRIKK